MTADQLSNPAALLVLAVVGLAFVRFGIWWAVLRVILAPLFRPLGLLLIAASVAAVFYFSS